MTIIINNGLNKLMRMRNIRKIKKDIKGRSVTSQRQLLLKLLRQSPKHLSAKELYKLAIVKNESISLATVYRNLRLFRELDLIEERRLGHIYCYYEMKESSDHQHLVCRSCDKVIEFTSPLIGQLLEELQHEHGFNVNKFELFLEGDCHQCHKGAAGEPE